MKAVIYRKYGNQDVLEYAEVEKPTPKAGEVLVKVAATSFNKADWYTLTGTPLLMRLMLGGILKPKHQILGFDISGTVMSVGENVTRYKIGDDVYGDLSGIGGGGLGEFVCVPENVMARKPTNISFEEAAAVPMAAVTALIGLRDDGQLQPGQKVLINGASGGVGTFAIQIAKALGAHVTAVCSTRNVEQARELGADHVIDYTKENFTENDEKYDLIFAVNGYHKLKDYQRTLMNTGIYVVAGGSMKQIFEVMLKGKLLERKFQNKFKSTMSRADAEKLADLTVLIEKGKIKPVIDKTFKLEDASKAMGYLGNGHAKGKIVVQIA